LGLDIEQTASTIREMEIRYVESHDFAAPKDFHTALSAGKVMATIFWDVKRGVFVRNVGKLNNRTFPQVPHSKIARI
jgi:hypothetical protein